MIKGFFPVSLEELEHELEKVPLEPSPAAYVFQIGHCGSTLVSRALAFSPLTLPLREPQVLKTLASSQRELGSTLSWLSHGDWQRLMDASLRMLDRRFRPDQLPVIKANSECNNICETVLASHPERRAVLLYSPLESYLAGMLRYKDKQGDIRFQSRARLEEWQLVSGSSDLNLSELSVVELIVIAWMGNMARFSKAMKRFPEQVMPSNFEDYLSRPAETTEEMAGFFGLEYREGQIPGHYQKISEQYSKDPKLPYSARTREVALDASRSDNAALISRGLRIAEQLVATKHELSALKTWF